MTLSNYLILFFAMSVCFFKSLPNGEYSNLLIVAAFSSSSLSGKIYSHVKNSYLPKFPDDKAEILAVCLTKKLYFFVQFCYLLF